MAGIHSSGSIEKFLGDGETRLIAAAYRDPARSGEFFLLQDGQAASLREWTRENLRCMFPDCLKPDLSAVSRRRKRDGFRHPAWGQKHTPESVNHIQGKAVVADWLARQFGPCAVEVESAANSQRDRVADVMLTLAGGARVAFEVQYSPLTVEGWRERHEFYQENGIVDVWLWGHTLLKARMGVAGGLVGKLGELQFESIEMGLPVFYLNPVERKLGIATNSWQSEDALAYEQSVSIRVEGLEKFTANERGIWSGLVSRLIEVSARREEHNKAVEQSRHDREARAKELYRRQISAARSRKVLEESEIAAHAMGAAVEASTHPNPYALRQVFSKGEPRSDCRVCGMKLADFLQPYGQHPVDCGRRRGHRF